jgi:hypothetical protein
MKDCFSEESQLLINTNLLAAGRFNDEFKDEWKENFEYYTELNKFIPIKKADE